MREIVRILCGSHLYGTNVESSDRDYKIVYIPDGKRILLQKADRLDPLDMVEPVKRLVADVGEPLAEHSPDVEFMSLRQYLKLLCQGQTNALDMFFAPREFYVGDPEPEWYTIQALSDRWISKNSAAFVGYCRQQAGKYSVKIDRYEAIKKAVDYLGQQMPLSQKLSALTDLGWLVAQSEHIEQVCKGTTPHNQVSHLSVCQVMVPMGATCALALSTFHHKLADYGKRVRAASNMNEKDWKSMYHAVRVACQAMELMHTGKLTFPRPERRMLKAIRLGKIPFEHVGHMIEKNLEAVQKAVEKSTLPEQPNWDHAEHLVETFYRSAVK